jgi:hypothetical protein
MGPSSLLARGLVVLVAAASPVLAQHDGSTHLNMNINLPDSIAHIIPRTTADHAHYAITTRDGKATLMLMDTTIVAQMTDRGLADFKAPMNVDTISDPTTRMFAKMALGALQPLFDHGIAYHLRDLSSATYADGRLQFHRTNGEEVFKDVEIGSGPLMADFAPDEAKAFARMATNARRKLQ